MLHSHRFARAFALAALLPLVLWHTWDAAAASPPLRITFLALPRGEATLIQAPGSKMVGLLGAGARGETSAVIQGIKKRGVQSVSVLIGGSWSEGHLGGVPELLRRFPVQSFLYSPLYQKTAAGERAIAAARARPPKRFEFGSATLDTSTVFFSPPCQFRNVGPLGSMFHTFANDPRCSLALEVSYDRVSFLSLGDSRQKHQRAMFKLADPTPDGTVLQISGQGSLDAVDLALLKRLGTRIVIIPTPQKGPRPDPRLLRVLANAKVKVYRTDQRGTITVTTDGRKIDVKTER